MVLPSASSDDSISILSISGMFTANSVIKHTHKIALYLILNYFIFIMVSNICCTIIYKEISQERLSVLYSNNKFPNWYIHKYLN